MRRRTEITANIIDLDGNVLAPSVAVSIKQNDRGSFRLKPVDSFNFEMDRPRKYRLLLEDGRAGDIQTMGFHLIDNSGTNFVTFRILNGLSYASLQTHAL